MKNKRRYLDALKCNSTMKDDQITPFKYENDVFNLALLEQAEFIIADQRYHRSRKNDQLIINTYTESHMPKDHQEAVLKYVSRRMTLLAITDIEKE